MSRFRLLVLVMLVGAMALGGCDAAQQRGGSPGAWNQGTPDDAVVAQAVQDLLKQDLTADNAVRVALLCNPSLQAVYENFGISQTDLVQAGLLKNLGIGAAPGAQAEPATAFIETALAPLRKRVPPAEFEQVRGRLTGVVLDAAVDVRRACYTLKGAEQAVAVWRQAAEGADRAANEAKRRLDVGKADGTGLALAQGAAQRVQMDVAASEADGADARIVLGRLLGQTGPAGWKVAAGFPELPANDPPFERLLAMAVSQRPDLAAATQETMPRMAWLEARMADVRTAVQLAYNHMTAARRAAVYVKTAVLPLCDQIGKIDAARRETGQGQVDMPGCEEVRRHPANARLAYVEAMRDYWIARSQLEHAVGGRLDVPPPAGMP